MTPAQKPAARKSREDAEERLRVAAAQKDASRFGELYELHFDRVYAYVSRRVGAREAAEDITADVFQRALAHLPRFEWRGVPFAAWLLRMAANAVADRWERAARERGTPAPQDSVKTETPKPEEMEECARLFGQVRALPADQRRIIELRFAEEKSIREIARELGRSEGAVKQLQFRALENLRKRMGGRHG